jgi:hypothetical protein
MLLIEEIINAKLRALQDVQDNIFEYLQVAVEKNADKFQDANVRQLDAGILSTGEKIKAPSYLPYDLYSPFTIREKKKKGQPTNRITLKDKGTFYESIKLEVDASGFEMDSNDSKSIDLQRKYTIDILGISEENLFILLDEVQKDLNFMIKNRIENA